MSRCYQATKWRKRLEQRGWISLRRRKPTARVFEFHVIYKGQLYSGRCHHSELDSRDMLTPGSLTYILGRTDLISEGVWRPAKHPGGQMGFICRPWNQD